jgi:small GTP-binding protein
MNEQVASDNNIQNQEEVLTKNKASVVKKELLNNKLNYQYLFKLALIGDSGSGKTSILLRFTDNTYNDNTQFTIGVDFKIVSMNIDDNLVKLQIWDTCGSERFKSLTTSFIKSCSAFILVFDITRMKTFKNLEFWMKVVKDSAKEGDFLCLIGNKSDLQNKRQVPLEDCVEFAKNNGLKYMETSAKNNVNIIEAFTFVAEMLYNKKKKDIGLETQTESNEIIKGEGISITDNTKTRQKDSSKCSC